jgi:hypothetical protein
MSLGLEAATFDEAEDMAGALEDAGPSEPGGLATSVASPELAEGMGVAAGAVLPFEEATGVSDTLEAAGAATLEAAGTAAPPPLEKSTTAGPGQVNFWESLWLTL